jgi:hypothetical protein
LRLTPLHAGIVTTALCACTSSLPTLNSPPLVAEPSAGAVLDRCLVRVRISQPGTDANAGQTLTDASDPHADWRVNGGPQIIASDASFVLDAEKDYTRFAPYVFAATLVPGANHLEAGRCNSLDECGWTPIDLTVKLGAGSPNPAFAGSGQLILPGYGLAKGYSGANSFTLLPDGRALVGVELGAGVDPHDALIAVRPDGTYDTSFGKAGVAVLPFINTRQHLVPRAGGGFLALLDNSAGAWLMRLGKDGSVDTSFGQNGTLPIPLPAGSGSGAFTVNLVTADSAGGFIVAGVVAIDNGSVFVEQVGPDGALVASKVLGPVSSVGMPAAIDDVGRIVLLSAGEMRKGSLANGLDATFGAVAVAVPPAAQMGVAILGDSTAFAFLEGQSGGASSSINAKLLMVAAGGSVKTIEIPFASPAGQEVQLLPAADGALYVASTLGHPAVPAQSATGDATPGTDVALARIRAGALDPSFGVAGIAHASFMLSWSPIAVDTIYDAPVAIALSPDGDPWVLGTSVSTPATAGTHTGRGPGTGIVRFMR